MNKILGSNIKMLQKLFLFVGVTVLVFSFSTAFAFGFFAGMNVFVIPCTCEGGATAWHFWVPLYLDSGASVTGPLKGSWVVGYSNYSLHPGVWAMGNYTQGNGTCSVGVEPYCYTLTSYGMINTETGASL